MTGILHLWLPEDNMSENTGVCAFCRLESHAASFFQWFRWLWVTTIWHSRQ